MMRYPFEEEFMGITYKMLAEYTKYDAIPGNATDEPEPEKIELLVIYRDLDGDGKFIEEESSEEYDEGLIQDILDSL